MPKIPVILSNGRKFEKKGDAIEHFRLMLHRYADEAIIDVRTDHDDLLSLLERYDAVITDGPSKIGAGVDHFFRRQNVGVGYSTPGFWVSRTEGSPTDFSFRDAVNGAPKSNTRQFYDACRVAVAVDLVAAKKRHFATYGDDQGLVRCELTDQLIAFEEAHLDHAYPTFGQLVITFKAVRGWQHGAPDGTITAPADNQTFSAFIDTSVAEAFRQFHHAAAILRVVAANRNLAMAAGQRQPRVKRPVKL